MTIQISVSPRAEAALKQGAAASGKDLTRYASELLEQAAIEPIAGQLEHLSDEEWSARSQGLLLRMNEYAKRRPVGHVIDDSREAIYAGRGE